MIQAQQTDPQGPQKQKIELLRGQVQELDKNPAQANVSRLVAILGAVLEIIETYEREVLYPQDTPQP